MTKSCCMTMCLWGMITFSDSSSLPLNFENLLNLTMFPRKHLLILNNYHQTWSKCMWPTDLGRVWFCIVGLGRLHFFALELQKTAAFDFVYTLASTNINLLAPSWVKMYMTIRSHMSLIEDQVGPDWPELSYIELEKLLFLTLFIP